MILLVYILQSVLHYLQAAHQTTADLLMEALSNPQCAYLCDDNDT